MALMELVWKLRKRTLTLMQKSEYDWKSYSPLVVMVGQMMSTSRKNRYVTRLPKLRRNSRNTRKQLMTMKQKLWI